ncbi:peptidoglycan DD-metalloendopeptidase family protein [Orrella sp. JC864]
MGARAGIGLLALAAACACPAYAQGEAPERIQARQSEAEQRQAELRGRIDTLQKAIDERESARKEAADALRESESAISRINRRLDELAGQGKAAHAELQSLEAAIVRQRAERDARQQELAAQLRTQYQSGLSPWTALLSGDDPQQIGRNLGYLDYVSRARAQALAALQRDIERLSALQRAADERRAEIEQVARDTDEQKAELVRQQRERATVLAKLEGQIQAQRAEAARLGRDDQRLSHVISELEKQVQAARAAAEAARKAAEAKRRAEAERRAQAAREAAQAQQRAEAERRAQLAREAEERARQIREAADAATRERLAAEEAARARRQAQARAAAQAQAQAQRREEPALSAPREPVRGTARPTLPTEQARGLRAGAGLAPPVRGPVMARFGTDRPEGGVWRGVLLRADEGTPVRAVAPGTVVYAAWLRGFGNLIIVDHGEQYLTVYAYNQSLLREVGDTVAAGEAIAHAGSTGGQVESGLYFEVRHRGEPVDPYRFIAR